MRLTASAFILAIAAITLVPGVTAADCAEPTPDFLLAQAAAGARTVFVGTVEPGGDQHLARLRVEEVWSGPDLAEVVWVRTGMQQPPWPVSEVASTWSSVDAELLLGERYLVATDADGGTDICSSMPVGPGVLAAAPDDARPPTPDGNPLHRPALFDTALGAALVAGLLSVGVLALVARRERRPPRGEHRSERAGRIIARGAVIGAMVGVLLGVVAELATTATRQLFPTDVGIVGFALVFGTPLAIVTGALAWWRGRPRSVGLRIVLVAVPPTLVGIAQVVLQWTAQ